MNTFIDFAEGAAFIYTTSRVKFFFPARLSMLGSHDMVQREQVGLRDIAGRSSRISKQNCKPVQQYVEMWKALMFQLLVQTVVGGQVPLEAVSNLPVGRSRTVKRFLTR